MKFDVGNFTFDSTFDSGNLQRVEPVRTTAEREYGQWFRADPVGFGRASDDSMMQFENFRFYNSARLSQLKERQISLAITLE